MSAAADQLDPSPEEDNALLDSHAAQLSEHFESVQIIATRRRPGGITRLAARGGGNFYASLGAVREWLVMQEERTRIQERNHE